MHFLDQAKIYIRSGQGGPGAVSFRREKYVEYGGPDGGNGGKGGDIIFEAVAGLNTLIDFRYAQHFKAPRGVHGSGKDRNGAAGKDLVIKVPVGTQIISDEDRETVLLDLTEAGQRVTFLEGGLGGRGNASYKTSTNRAPRQHQPGVVMGGGQQIAVGRQAGQPEALLAALARAQHLAGAAQFEVLLGDDETVIGFAHGGQPRLGGFA